MPVYTFIHTLLNVLVQIANKMGLLQIKWDYKLHLFALNKFFRLCEAPPYPGP
jgi:hypothetical protein